MTEDTKNITKKTKKKRIDGSKFIDLNPTVNENDDIVEEEVNLDERAPLSLTQRRQRGRTMRRYKNKIAMAKKRAQRRKASPEKLKIRARKRARDIIRKRLAQGKKYSEMSPAEKIQLDKRLQRIPDTAISRIATRQLPQVRKAEMERLAKARGGGTKKESIDEAFEEFLNERRECPPKRMHMAMTKEGKVKFDKRFKFFRKKNPDELEESFGLIIETAEDLMEVVENMFGETTALQRTQDQIRRERESAKQRHNRLRDAARRRDQIARANESTLEKDDEDPCWDGYVQLGTKMKNGKEVPNCVPKNESSDPYDREEGTDSLVSIYKKETPGQKHEAYHNISNVEGNYGSFRLGARVRFDAHSIDMADGEETREGTVIGTNIKHLRVRDDEGRLYKVRHNDAELIESLFVFTLDEMFEFSELTENVLDKAVSAIRKHMTKGKSLEDVIWEFSAATGFKVPTKEIYRHYIKTHGDPKKAISKMSDREREALIRKYS